MTMAIGDSASDFTLTSELSIAAVAVMLPKNGEIIFPKPWASNSLLE